jgi:hypothetical protein
MLLKLYLLSSQMDLKRSATCNDLYALADTTWASSTSKRIVSLDFGVASYRCLSISDDGVFCGPGTQLRARFRPPGQGVAAADLPGIIECGKNAGRSSLHFP